MQPTKFQFFSAIILVIFFVSCNQFAYNDAGFGGGFGLPTKKNSPVIEKSKDVKNIGTKTIDFDPTLFELDTLGSSKNLIAYSKPAKPNKFTKLKVKLMSKLFQTKLPKSQFVEDYGNWLRSTFDPKENKTQAPNQPKKKIKKLLKNKKNYNEDQVNLGLSIAGICAGLLLIMILIGSGVPFVLSESLNGCVYVILCVILGVWVLVGLLMALIGALS
jgi:hypothetical protein